MKLEIELTPEGYEFLAAEARATHGQLTVEQYARSILAQHVYQSKVAGRRFDAARAAMEAIDK